MRADVQQIFMKTPHEKQVMMFSATLSKDVRPTVKRFMQDVRKSTPLHTCTTTATLPACHRECAEWLPQGCLRQLELRT